MKKNDLLLAGYTEAEIESVFHKKGVRRKEEEWSDQEIAEKQEALRKFREMIARDLMRAKEIREAENKRQWYLKDLKLHPEKYIDRKGLYAAGKSRKEVEAMKPLFWKGCGYYGQKKYYYEA